MGLGAPGAAAAARSKVAALAKSGADLAARAGEQVPYPFAHLVAFTVYSSLIALAVWTGGVARAGGLSTYGEAHGPAVAPRGTAVMAYCLLILASVVMGGLLDVQELTESMFGAGACRLALRSQTTGLLRASRGLLWAARQEGPGTGWVG